MFGIPTHHIGGFGYELNASPNIDLITQRKDPQDKKKFFRYRQELESLRDININFSFYEAVGGSGNVKNVWLIILSLIS